MAYFIQDLLSFAIPLMIVALAGVFAERSGVINIALEGIMIFGAFIGVLITRAFVSSGWLLPETGQLFLVIISIISMIGGGIFALLLAFASIHLKADQTIGGTALNLLAPAVVLFSILLITNGSWLEIGGSYGQASLFMMFQEDFGFDPNVTLPQALQLLFNGIYPTTYYAIFIFIVLSIILYTTKFGLRLRACGENPQAADSVGINVKKMRYVGTIISGCLAGFGGFVLVLAADGCTANGDVAGMGFLALAVMIFGNWKPLNIALAALLFGALKSLSINYMNFDFNGDGIYILKNLGISSHIYRLIPYVITLVVLAFTSKSSRAPKAEGVPYDKGMR